MRYFQIRTFRFSRYAWSWFCRPSLVKQETSFPGISYEQKDRVVRELAPERNNKLRRALIHIHGWNGQKLTDARSSVASRLSVANVLGNSTGTQTGNLDAFLAGDNTVELNRHRRRTLVAVRIVGKTHHTGHA